jgi:hypothetical protein
MNELELLQQIADSLEHLKWGVCFLLFGVFFLVASRFSRR